MKLIWKSKKKNDCGIVAAYNVASWCGKKFTYDQIEKVAKSCGYKPKNGIYYFQFGCLIKKLDVPFKVVKLKSVEDMESRLNNGKFLVFLYTPTGQETGHAITAFQSEKSFEIINPDKTRVTWKDFVYDIEDNGMKSFHVFEIPSR